MNTVLRFVVLVLWALPMTVGALAFLLVAGVQVGWAIMGEWIERIEP